MNLLGYVDRQQPVAIKIDRVFFAAGQNHLAEFGPDAPLIGNGRRDKCSQTALSDRKVALIDDLRTGLRRLVHGQRTTRDKFPGILRTDAGSGHHEPGGIDLRALAERHTGLVHEYNLAVGRDFPRNLRRIGTDHLVQRDCLGGGLVEGHGMLGADIETLPVNRAALCALSDGRILGVRVGDCNRAAHNHSTLRAGIGRRRSGCGIAHTHGCRQHHQGCSLQGGRAQKSPAIATNPADQTHTRGAVSFGSH